MARLIVLGSSYVIPDETHENTHLALLGAEETVLVDCPGRVMIRARRAGLDVERVGDIILTHFHPDHVDGVPMLIMELWLRGRKRPMRFYGLEHCLQRIERLMDDYDQAQWPGLFPISYHPVEDRPGAPVLENADYRITATPVKHFVPTIGLRVEDKATGHVLAYTCDTEPCPGTLQLAAHADLLIHEAAGTGMGHSTAAQAAEAARDAHSKRLALIHYRTGGADTSALIPEAATVFGGPVILTEDLMELEW